MAQYVLPGADSISVSRAAADRLIAGREGAAALAYLCILRAGTAVGPELLKQDLGISDEEADRLMQRLADMGLIALSEKKKEFTADEMAEALQQKEFSFLANQAECLFGSVLTAQDIQRLLYMYSSLELPAEVLLQMMQFFKSEVRRRYGPGRRLSMAKLEKMALDWKSRGIVTLEEAEAYIRRREEYSGRENEIKRALEIYDRRFTAGEQKYIDSWLDMGFGTDAIHLCYERTLDRIHALNFKYMDSIFLSWHKKGLHTPAEIEAGDALRPVRRSPAAAAQPAGSEMPDEDETGRLRRLAESMKEGS